ncbi:MAG TPA: hypothetical protein VLE94_17385 [Burkholderiaceae bacterium]|nr:hypothetical protein [Burkholderiaceae bacterium]
MVLTPFAAIVLLLALITPAPRMPLALLVCCLFGASAAIELPALGGAPITPAILLMPFVVWRALREQGVDACMRPLAFPQAGFWLLVLVTWGVLSAYFVPRFLDGQTLLYGTDRGAMNGVRLLPLQPLSTNLTQAAYAIAALLTFAATVALVRPSGRLAAFGDAVLLLAAINVAAAMLNLAELYLPIPSLLQSVRNAGYAILVGGDVGGLQRISGTFAESSGFASFTLPLFAFTATLWRERVRPWASGLLALATLALLLLSTSSTAYATLAAYVSLVALCGAWRTLTRSQALRLGKAAWLLWVTLVMVCVALLLRPEIADHLADFFGVTVVRKLDSLSGLERGSWNQQAWINFVDSHGLGTGLGSARASSFVLVLLSNVGVPGCVLFLMFLGHVLWAPTPAGIATADDPRATATRRAARHAVLAAVLAAAVSAVVFDLGMAFYAFAAAAAAPALARHPRPSGALHGHA